MANQSDLDSWGPLMLAVVALTATTGLGFAVGLILGFYLG